MLIFKKENSGDCFRLVADSDNEREECIVLFPNSDDIKKLPAGVNTVPSCLDGASEYEREHYEHFKFCPYDGNFSNCPNIPIV